MLSMMWPLQQAEISFIPHVVLGYATLIQSRSTSVETDMLAMGGMTLDSVSSTRMGEPNFEEKEKIPEVETRDDGANKE